MKKVTFSIWICLTVVGAYASVQSTESETSTIEDIKTVQKLLTINKPEEGAIVGTQMIVSGTYSKNLSKDIWVIIWPENAPGLGWPQFGDPVKMTSAKKSNGNWSAICNFGGPPQGYEILVYTSHIAGSLLLQQRCQKYGGSIPKKDLPDGFVKQVGRTVTRIRRSSEPKRMKSLSEPKRMKSLLDSIQDDITEGEVKAGYSYYKDEYRTYESFFWYKIAGWMFEDAIERSAKGEHVNKVLDLGGGYGTLLIYATFMYGTEGICFDVGNYIFPNVLEKYNISYMKGDIERGRLPQSEKFNVIIMTEVLEHFNFHPVPTLKKIYETLTPGGSFFLSTPDAESIWGRTYKHYKSLSEIPTVDPNATWINDHIWQYNSTELRSVLREAGFKIKRFDLTTHPTKYGYKHFNVWVTKS
ncbi:MAG: class I SAM-dependent methyltransferase [Planctomycetota bacterium]|jgi:SAM-dependent methyltransferase